MRLADLLSDDLIALPMEAGDIQEALQMLLSRAWGDHPEEARKLAGELASGSVGQVVRVNENVVLVVATVEALEATSASLGLAKAPFGVSAEGGGTATTARAVLVLLSPRGLLELRAEVMPTLVRALGDEDLTRQLLAAESIGGVRAIKELMDTEVRERFLVTDALTPVKYRVYPDTPLSEVVDLIVRRGLRAVPVVGERYEVLGLITAGDVFEHLLPRRGSTEEEPESQGASLLARDLMTRSVLCVSEDQPLIEAASIMVNRNVDQLPVVRAGELVGSLTREAILRILFTGRTET